MLLKRKINIFVITLVLVNGFTKLTKILVIHLGSLKHGIVEENMAELKMNLTALLSTKQTVSIMACRVNFITHFDSST